MQDQLAVLLEPEPMAICQRSIVIVEDDPTISEVLSVRLERQGFRTCVAGCGQEGLALAKAERPSLVLLDLHLPDVDGFTICRELVDDPATSGIPVIILSGMERPDVIRRSRGAGCQYYVRKPYDPNVLLVLIDQAIRQAEGGDLN
jgi:DNA-binding response OmpR family regulator